MPKRYERTCEQCNQPYSGRGKRFCSNHCRVTWTNLHHNVAKRPDVRAKFSRIHKGNNYCVGRILSTETKQKIAAALKGRPTGRKPAQKFVDSGRASRFSATSPRLRGEQHPSWKGGLTPQRTKDFQTLEYKTFVATVLHRDNYTCQDCGAANGNGEKITLQVHHTVPYGILPKHNRYNPDFGLTLCLDCHNKTKQKKPPPSTDYIPKPRICQNCGQEYKIRYPGKYCLTCRTEICCPVCGSTICSHTARKNLQQSALL